MLDTYDLFKSVGDEPLRMINRNLTRQQVLDYYSTLEKIYICRRDNLEINYISKKNEHVMLKARLQSIYGSL
jgi:hypothetical protein